MDGVKMIAEERQRQVDVEGWNPEHDDEHVRSELAEAGACYALEAAQFIMAGPMEIRMPRLWPFDKSWWKPSSDPVRNLVKAGALIAAEIDRIQRNRNLEYSRMETRNRMVAIEELKKQPVSDPEKFMRCVWCGNEMLKSGSGICDDCCQF